MDLVRGRLLGLLVQLVAEGLGHLFGFRPGLVGVWVGLLGGALTGVAVLLWQDRARDRDAKVLAANQREISDTADKVQMIEAHTAAMKVSELWPQLPVREGPVEPLLRKALWDLSGELLARRRLADTLTDLRQAAVGVPADNPAANELQAQIRRADTLHKARDAEVTDRIGRLHTLAARCVRFCDEQAAIKRAQQANRSADAVLGAVQPVDRQPVDQIGAFTQQLDAVLDAYRRLVRDAPDGG